MPTLRELAEELGLSVSTVSRALRDLDNVSPETKKRVLQVAAEMGYSSRRTLEPTLNDIAQLAEVSVSTVSRVINNQVGVSSEISERIHQILKNIGYKPSALHELAEKSGSSVSTVSRALRDLDVRQYSLDEVLVNVIDAVIEITGAERGFLMLKDPSGELVFRVALGMDHETIEEPEFQVSRTIVQQVAESGKPLLTSNAQDDFASSASVINLKLRSILCVPLQHKGLDLGLIYVDNRTQNDIFTNADLELLAAVAASAAAAIENARLYEIAIEKGRDEFKLIPKYGTPTDFILSSKILETQVTPLIKTISNFQSTLSKIKQEEPIDIAIRLIDCRSPINIGLDGASEALRVIRETIVKWEKENRKKLANLRELELGANIALMHANANESKTRRRHEEQQIHKTAAEAERIRAEADKLRAEADKLRAEAESINNELLEEKVNLAIKIIEKYGDELSQTQKLSYLSSILSQIDQLISSDLEIL